MGKISTNQQAEAKAIPPALPPQAAPLVEALEAMKVLQDRLTAAEGRAASCALEIAPLTTAMEDALAAGAEADDAQLVGLERDHRRATAEVAGLRRLIEAQRAAVQVAMVACEVAHREAATRAKAALDGRVRAASAKLLGALAEASAFYYANGKLDEALAVARVRIPTCLFDVPDNMLWVGLTGLEGDAAPTANDATMQLDAMAMLVRQAQGVVANG